MEDITLINNTSVYRNPAPQSPLQGQNVLQPATVYSKIMLRTVELSESDYSFDALAVERNMPSNNGANEITFKRMLSLAAHTQPLVEGIPPASDQGRMVAIKASTTSYGRVMKFTDKVNWAVVDPLISEYTRQLSLKIPETKDLLAQEALLAECQMFYACKKQRSSADSDVWEPISGGGAVTHITKMTSDCVPTIDEFRKIVLSMEAAKVRPRQGANFTVLATPAVMFDLITDKRVKEFMKWENTARSYTTDMVVDLFSLAFKKAKTAKSDNTYIDENGDLRYLYTDGTNNYALKTQLTAHTISSTNYVSALGDRKIVLSTGVTTEHTSTDGTSFNMPTASTEILNLHYAYVLGEDALYRVGVEGHTAPQFIKKELGSAGTEDPLNQRQSIGWKIDSLGYKVPNPDAVVCYVSVPTQYRVNVNARPDLKNQFTDYDYGYVDASGNFFYPEQVMQTVVSGAVKYYVRGTTTEVTSVKLTSLVKPVNGGRIGSNGQKERVIGTLPQTAYVLKSSLTTGTPIRFMADQVAKSPNASYNTKYYVKGMEGTASSAPTSAAEVVPLPAALSNISVPKADGTEMETVIAVDEGNTVNNTGDPRIDG